MSKVLISSHNTWSVFNFRQNLIKTLIKEGKEVHIYAPFDSYKIALEELGCIVHEAYFIGTSKNIFSEITSLIKWILFIKKNKYDICLHFGIKPNLYGSIACLINGIPYINNITGLGQIFQSQSILQKFIILLYSLTQKKALKVFFQNKDDCQLFIDMDILSDDKKIDILPGSGVDLERFQFNPIINRAQNKVKFYFFGRILISKGILFFVDAAKEIIQIYGKSHVEFCIVGFIDKINRNGDSISMDQIKKWENDEIIKYLGESNKIETIIFEADCIILPSYYREGTPRSLLESIAMGIPIITTNSVGCKDVVIDGVNGYMVEPNNLESLKNAVSKMINLTAQQRSEMGAMGRKIAEKKYDEKIVIDKYLKVLVDANV
jgi:glycosyltransferase involved in cell wall biosynthesis